MIFADVVDSSVEQKRNVKRNKKKLLPKVLLRKFCLTNLFLFDKQNSQEDTFVSDSRGFMSITNILWALISAIVLFTIMPLMLPYMNNATADLEANGYWEAATLVKLLPFAMVVIFIRGLVKAGEPIIYSVRNAFRREGDEEDEFW